MQMFNLYVVTAIRRCLPFLTIFFAIASLVTGTWASDEDKPWPSNLRVVLENTLPLKFQRLGRLPLYVLPITNSLSGLDEEDARLALRQLDQRGIGYSVDWNHANYEASIAEGLRIGRLQMELGQPVAVNATACLYSFFDGSEATLHVDDEGNRFADTSSGGNLGCSFAFEHRVPVIKERIARFLRAYKKAGIRIDFIFADWEIDGPIEWNGAWSTCKRCQRCRKHLPNIEDFRSFQSRLRAIRSEVQRVAFADNVTEFFPQALVGNYGVYPHNGERYWYDYFERPDPTLPGRRDQRALYREWAHEFDGTGYTFAMPVVYTWYPTFDWYGFEDTDYRWFYNMLLVASNAGQNTSAEAPIIPFVHWNTTAPPPDTDPNIKQFNQENYRELLWHLLLRGHDTFFLWCLSNELAEEVRLVHEVYAESLEYAGFLNRGTPIHFDVPREPEDVVSGLRLGSQVLARRTHFGGQPSQPIGLVLSHDERITVPPKPGLHVVPVEKSKPRTGLIQHRGEPAFPIGFYEMPAEDDELKEMARAGVNLVRCGDSNALDRAHAAGMSGWMPLDLRQGSSDTLRQRIESVANHPALAVWEGPDEIVWTFTAYSFLKERAGFTREDWNQQAKIAVEYSEREAAKIMPAMREAIAMIRELDGRDLPVWINEAADSDVKFARQYMPFIDITGCDYYAVRSTGTDVQSIGRLVNRWEAIGHGKPVWMVLQAFSWHALRPERGRMYPSFAQSRFMAYDAIVHGGEGIFYWGSNWIEDPKFRESLYALTSELSRLQPFLIGDVLQGVRARTIDDLFDPPGRGVRAMLLRSANDYLLILVNEDGHRHLGVEVSGLEALAERDLSLLYGDETFHVSDGTLVTRMQPFDVKLFCTHAARYESPRGEGRDYE